MKPGPGLSQFRCQGMGRGPGTVDLFDAEPSHPTLGYRLAQDTDHSGGFGGRGCGGEQGQRSPCAPQVCQAGSVSDHHHGPGQTRGPGGVVGRPGQYPTERVRGIDRCQYPRRGGVGFAEGPQRIDGLRGGELGRS